MECVLQHWFHDGLRLGAELRGAGCAILHTLCCTWLGLVACVPRDVAAARTEAVFLHARALASLRLRDNLRELLQFSRRRNHSGLSRRQGEVRAGPSSN